VPTAHAWRHPGDVTDAVGVAGTADRESGIGGVKYANLKSRLTAHRFAIPGYVSWYRSPEPQPLPITSSVTARDGRPSVPPDQSYSCRIASIGDSRAARNAG
jgi:hypothetical protein